MESWPAIDVPAGLAEALAEGGIARILVTRTEHVGDLLWATPILRALRARFPKGALTVLTTPYAAGALAGNPHVDAVVTTDRAGGGDAHDATVATLRAGAFDLALILDRRYGANATLARRAGARFVLAPAEPFSMAEAHRRGLHVLDANAALLAPLGCPPIRRRLDLVVADAARAWVADFLADRGVGPKTPLLGIHAGCGSVVLRGRKGARAAGRRLWFADRYAEILGRFARATGGRAALTGLEGERAGAAPILEAAGDLGIDAIGRTDLGRLAALIERCTVYVAPDTGPMHIAAALGTPLVALFGPSSPIVSGPLGDPARIRVLAHPFPCAPCDGWVRKACLSAVCMRSIGAGEVSRAVEAFARRGPAAHERLARAAA